MNNRSATYGGSGQPTFRMPCKLCGGDIRGIGWITNYGQTCNLCAPMGDLKGAAK
jgi:hypothetical protein